MSKANWMAEHLQSGEQYGGMLLGQDGGPDYHVVVADLVTWMSHADAIKVAKERGLSVPSARELFSIYLNRPDLFVGNPFETDPEKRRQASAQMGPGYWTTDACAPAKWHSSEEEAKAPHFLVARPTYLGTDKEVSLRTSVGQKARPNAHSVMLIRRIGIDNPARTVEADYTGLVEALKDMNSRVRTLGGRLVENVSLTITGLQEAGILTWVLKTGRMTLYLALIPESLTTGLSGMPWRRVQWNLHFQPKGDIASYHTGVWGSGTVSTFFVDQVLRTVEEYILSNQNPVARRPVGQGPADATGNQRPH